MKIIIEIEDKQAGRIAIKCTPSFKELVDMRMSGKQATAADAAMFMLNKVWELLKEEKKSKIKSVAEMMQVLRP